MRVTMEASGVTGVRVASAGLLAGGAPATGHARAVVAGLDAHTSRQVTAEMVAEAELVVGLARVHVREIALFDGSLMTRCFTLKELVRRGSDVGPRQLGQTLESWLAQLGMGRTTHDLLGDSADDDVADPVGRPLAVYRQVAAELDDLTGRLVDLVWPARAASSV